MKKRRNIIIIISLALCIVTGIFMFNENIELKQKLEQTHSVEEISLVKRKEVFKDALISIAAGMSIYVIFYGIPHEYELAEKAEKEKEKLNKIS